LKFDEIAIFLGVTNKVNEPKTMRQFNNPTEYLDAMNHTADNKHVQIIRDMIARARQVRDELSGNRPKRRHRMTARIAKLTKCRDDLLAGRPNAFWSNLKTRVQKAIDDDIIYGLGGKP
jgi:hypothetical protein